MAFAFLHRLMHRVWRRVRGQTLDVQIVALDEAGRAFLVGDAQGSAWRLPSGRLLPGESALERVAHILAACGIEGALDATELKALLTDMPESESDHVAVYVVRHAARASHGGADAIASEFFPRNALPDGTTPATRRAVEENAA